MFIVIGSLVLYSSVSSALTAAANGGIVEYNEQMLHDYADVCYSEAFGQMNNYEDYLLLTVLINSENYSEFCYIAWPGDDIDYSIKELLGNNYTDLGQVMNSTINYTNYEYSLDADLAQVMNIMADKITALGLDRSHTCYDTPESTESYLVNKTTLPMTENTVNRALTAFTEETGITVVLVVDEMEAVFGRNMPSSYILTIVICAAFVLIGVITLVKLAREKIHSKSNQNEPHTGGSYYDR